MDETELTLLRDEILRLRRAHRLISAIALAVSVGLIAIALRSPTSVAAQSTPTKTAYSTFVVSWLKMHLAMSAFGWVRPCPIL